MDATKYCRGCPAWEFRGGQSGRVRDLRRAARQASRKRLRSRLKGPQGGEEHAERRLCELGTWDAVPVASSPLHLKHRHPPLMLRLDQRGSFVTIDDMGKRVALTNDSDD